MYVQMSMKSSRPIYVIGDIHGHIEKLVRLLQQIQLIDAAHAWTGGTATLWFIGDLVDRGPDSIAVLDLVMRLQTEAATIGGTVTSLLGNHEMLLLAAYRFGRRSTGLGCTFLTRWKSNGGKRKDIARLTLQHLDWMAQLPAMVLIDNYLLMHADAPLYIQCGHTVDEVNATFNQLLGKSDALAWEEMLEDFARRGAFLYPYGTYFAQRVLEIFGGKNLIHGHTPINIMRSCSPQKVDRPWIYADDHCINVDGGMSLGGPGFVYQLRISD